MSEKVRKSLQDAVLESSSSKEWEQARQEWSEVTLIYNGVSKSNCVCGNKIKYAYELVNHTTGLRLFPIGSDCIRHFKNTALEAGLEREGRLLAKLNHLTRKIQRKQEIRVNKQDFDLTLLEWLWDKGAFKADLGNAFQPEKDYHLFLEVFHGGSWSKANPIKRARMDAVLNQFLKPFLLGSFDEDMYLIQLGKERAEFEQDLRYKAKQEREKRETVLMSYSSSVHLAIGPAEKAYQDYFAWEKELSSEERKWEEVLYGKNQTERLFKAQQVQKEIQKGKRAEEQPLEKRQQNQVWLLKSYFLNHPSEKQRLEQLVEHYRSTAQIPFEESYFSEKLLDFFYKIKVFEFEIHPEKVLAFLKLKLGTTASHMEMIWIKDILEKDIKPFLDRMVV